MNNLQKFIVTQINSVKMVLSKKISQLKSRLTPSK